MYLDKHCQAQELSNNIPGSYKMEEIFSVEMQVLWKLWQVFLCWRRVRPEALPCFSAPITQGTTLVPRHFKTRKDLWPNPSPIQNAMRRMQNMSNKNCSTCNEGQHEKKKKTPLSVYSNVASPETNWCVEKKPQYLLPHIHIHTSRNWGLR